MHPNICFNWDFSHFSFITAQKVKSPKKSFRKINWEVLTYMSFIIKNHNISFVILHQKNLSQIP